MWNKIAPLSPYLQMAPWASMHRSNNCIVFYCMEMYIIHVLYGDTWIESLYCMRMYIIHGLSRWIVLYCMYESNVAT